MKINVTNKEQINNIYVHDSRILSFQYNLSQETVSIILKSEDLNKKYYIDFKSVVFMEFRNFKILYAGDYVLDWCLYDVSPMISKICADEYAQGVSNCGLAEHIENCISTLIFFNSADKWIIVCKEIDFIEQELEA